MRYEESDKSKMPKIEKLQIKKTKLHMFIKMSYTCFPSFDQLRLFVFFHYLASGPTQYNFIFSGTSKTQLLNIVNPKKVSLHLLILFSCKLLKGDLFKLRKFFFRDIQKISCPT